MNFKDERLSLRIKLFYGLGALGLNLTTGLFGTWTLTFYIRIIGLDPLLWAFAWLGYLIWNAVNDPIFGLLSDRTRTKYGRRIPYLMVGGPLLSITFVVVYLTPLNFEQWGYFLWLLIALIIYDSFFTIVGLNFNALMADLTINPEERAHLNLFAGLGGGIGLSLTYILPLLFINYEVAPFSQNLPPFLTIVMVFAIFGTIFIAFTAFGIKEPPELVPESSDTFGLWFSTKATLKNKAFLTFVIFNFMMTYVVYAIQSNLPFYMADVIGVSGDNILSQFPLIFFLTFSVIGYPFGLYLNKTQGNKRAVFYLSIIVVIGFILITIANDTIFANISFMILGFGYSGQTLLVYTLLADVIDKDELETGQRREGAYFGINALITKPAQSVSAVMSGLIFLLTSYNQDLGPGEGQPLGAIIGIKMLIGLIPGIFIIIGLISLWYYPLDGISKEYLAMKTKVKLLHDKKLEELKKKLSKRTGKTDK
jgi:GPH family glycoside/pentoside/hexuronide:cation symporter